MSIASFSGVAHVALVVRDMTTSVHFYEDVLGFERIGEVTEGPPAEGHPRRLMRHPGSGLTLGIHEPHRRSGDRFDPQRTGLDHVAVTVIVGSACSRAPLPLLDARCATRRAECSESARRTAAPTMRNRLCRR